MIVEESRTDAKKEKEKCGPKLCQTCKVGCDVLRKTQENSPKPPKTPKPPKLLQRPFADHTPETWTTRRDTNTTRTRHDFCDTETTRNDTGQSCLWVLSFRLSAARSPLDSLRASNRESNGENIKESFGFDGFFVSFYPHLLLGEGAT